MDSYEQDSCIHGYHIYQNIWTAKVNEHFVCEREPLNSSNRYVVAVLKDNVIVSHLPRQLSWILSLFLLKMVQLIVWLLAEEIFLRSTTGRIRNPMQVNFKGKYDDIKKLKHLLACKAPAFSRK